MHILLGITGGIAAYKSCELLRLFQKAGHQVKVIMTDTAQHFVGQKTFESLTQDQVYTSKWLALTQGNAHIDLARWADVCVVAPATAHTIFKCAHGKADDLLSTVYLAFEGLVYFAPAMNTVMLNNIAVTQNIDILTSQGHVILDPQSGELACKEVGKGKMMEPEDIFEHVMASPHKTSKLLNRSIVITAGPTREYLDPVRFISSPSTGLMGVALAHEALARGAHVKLIHGPMHIQYKGQGLPVTTAKDMFDITMEHMPCDIFVGAAAVADYTPATPQLHKLKKTDQGLTLELKRTQDLIAHISQNKLAKELVIGFAAQTEDVVKQAQKKLKDKKLDVIVGNSVYESEKGFGPQNNTFYLIDGQNTKTIHDISKPMFARVFWDDIENRL